MKNRILRPVLLLGVLFVFGATTLLAQSGTITGTVTDSETSETLPGVNVFIQSLSRGIATNVDGEYTLEDVPYGTYELQFSFIGYETEMVNVTVDDETETIDVALSASVEFLEDVVVTAFGVEKQIKDLPYSAQNVDVEAVIQSGSDNLMSALNGRVPGMKVQTASGMGGSTDIILRGANSITGNNQVLFVVDGVPYANERFNTNAMEQGFAGYDYGTTGVDINPNSIASMTILKGPAAAALYGSRASNGAIIIETKQGTPGQDRVNVSFNTSVGVSMVDASTFPTYQNEYGAGYIQHFFHQDVDGDGQDDLVSIYTADASYGMPFDPNTMVYQWDAFYPNHPNYGKPTPYAPPENQPIEFFETGTNVENSLLINGGIAEGGYYSLGYNQSNVRGIMPNSSLDKYKLSFSGGYEVSDKLTVDASINYSKTEGLGRPERGYSVIMSAFRQWWQTDVDVLEQKAAYFRNKPAGVSDNITWNLTGDRSGAFYWNNPYFEVYENYANDSRDRYTGYAEAQYDVADWLSLSGQVSVDNYNMLIEERNAVTSVGVPYYERRTHNYSENNYTLLANYNKSLSDQIDIDGLVGMNIRRQYKQGIEAQTNGGLVVPGLYSLNNSENAILFPEETQEPLGVNGLFASFNLNYGNFLNIALTGRRDKASSLPEDENVYYYPSASVGFTFSEFINNDWLSFGKVRASVSQVGNTAPVFSLNDTYIRRNANFGPAPLYTLPSTKNNPNLKPEITKSWEIGAQLGFFNDRLFLDATYYDENTINQIYAVTISGASGYTQKYVNAGNVQNTGFELSLTGRPVTTADFSWTINANWSKNNSLIKELAPDVDYFEMVGPQGGISIGGQVGEPYGVIRGTDFVYHEESGKRVVDPATGRYLVSSASDIIIGNMNPDWTGGISNQFDYKNWSLNFLVDVRWGGDIFSLDQWYGQGTGLYPITAGLNDKGNPKRDPVSEGGGVRLDGVNPDGTPNETYGNASNYLSVYGFVFSPHAAYVYDASFIKLREAGLTYNLPLSLIDEIGVLRGASVSVVGRNLWIIHKNIPFADPEQTLGAANLGGYQGGNLPAVRNVTFNLQLNF